MMGTNRILIQHYIRYCSTYVQLLHRFIYLDPIVYSNCSHSSCNGKTRSNDNRLTVSLDNIMGNIMGNDYEVRKIYWIKHRTQWDTAE